MRKRTLESDDSTQDGLFTVEEVAEFLKVSTRMVLMLPIPQIKIGPRTTRFRLKDVYEYVGGDNPNL